MINISIKAPSSPAVGEGKPYSWDNEIGDIDRWEDDGGRHLGTRPELP